MKSARTEPAKQIRRNIKLSPFSSERSRKMHRIRRAQSEFFCLLPFQTLIELKVNFWGVRAYDLNPLAMYFRRQRLPGTFADSQGQAKIESAIFPAFELHGRTDR